MSVRAGDTDEASALDREPAVQEIRFIHKNWLVLIWVVTMAFSVGGFVMAMRGQASAFEQHKQLQATQDAMFQAKDKELEERLRQVELVVATIPGMSQTLGEVRRDVKSVLEHQKRW